MDGWLPQQVERSRAMLLLIAAAVGAGALSMMRPSPSRVGTAPNTALYGSVAGARLLAPTIEMDRTPADDDGFVDDTGWEGEDDAAPVHDSLPPDLVLIGTSVSDTPALQTAVFRHPERAVAQFYHPGDRIGGYTVETVASREVVLTAPGGRQAIYTLSLYPDDDGGPKTNEPPLTADDAMIEDFANEDLDDDFVADQ